MRSQVVAFFLTLNGALLVAGHSVAAVDASAQADADPAQLAQRINERKANEGRVGVMHFELENRRGHKRSRTARIFHAESADATNVAIYFTAPGAIEDTAFLSLDRRSSTDENWLYLPATERVRRLPASERGDYFMGTDLTYGDIKDDFKFSADDWKFSRCSVTPWPETDLPCLAGEAVSPAIARELGYGSFVATVDTTTWFPRQVRYFDTDGLALKDVEVQRQEKVGEAWTAMAFTLANLQSGHTTRVHFTDMQHWPALPGSVFDANSLEFGVPALKPGIGSGD